MHESRGLGDVYKRQIRFGFSPLYNTFAEAGRAAGVLAQIIQNELFLEARYSVRQKVT